MKNDAAIEFMYAVKDVCEKCGAKYEVTFTRIDDETIDVVFKINKYFSSIPECVYDEKAKDRIEYMTGKRPK